MLVKDNAGVEQGTLIDSNGVVLNRPAITLSAEDARLLREYKKFLQKQGLKEALYCSHCWTGEREDGCKAFVTDSQIGIICRCRIRFHQGQSL